MDSVRMQLGMLSMITSQTNELSRKTQVKQQFITRNNTGIIPEDPAFSTGGEHFF